MDTGTVLKTIELSELQNRYDLERDSEGAFVWTRGTFSLARQNAQCLLLHACYHGQDGELSFRQSDGTWSKFRLEYGWRRYGLPLDGAPEIIHFQVSPVPISPGDSRELGLMIRSVAFVDDAEMQRQLSRQSNYCLNQAEFEAGAVKLKSIPPQVRTALATQCNIKPPCVYCNWDYAKKLESRCDLDLGNVEMLRELGDFVAMATEVHDASWGEIFAVATFAESAEYLLQTGAVCAFTTNGILMTEDKYQPMLGRPTRLYISLDASSAPLYSRYRNNSFDAVVTNTRRLCHIKKKYNNKPEVHIVCVAMQSNYDDVPAVLDLAAELGVDGFFLQALHKQNMSCHLPQQRNGYRFVYDNECLSWSQLQALSEKLRPRAKSLDIHYQSDHQDFSQVSVSDESVPLCTDPWKTLWITTRGILPCCFGRFPVAHWDQRGNRSLAQFVEENINAPIMQQIRRALAQRELADYCRLSTSCPIVKKFSITKA